MVQSTSYCGNTILTTVTLAKFLCNAFACMHPESCKDCFRHLLLGIILKQSATKMLRCCVYRKDNFSCTYVRKERSVKQCFPLNNHRPCKSIENSFYSFMKAFDGEGQNKYFRQTLTFNAQNSKLSREKYSWSASKICFSHFRLRKTCDEDFQRFNSLPSAPNLIILAESECNWQSIAVESFFFQIPINLISTFDLCDNVLLNALAIFAKSSAHVIMLGRL